MKIRKKILLTILLVIIAIIVAGLCRFIQEEKRFTEYSTYCMDAVRAELGEYLSDIVSLGATEINGEYLYSGSVSYEGVRYNYSCTVSGKDKVDLNLEIISSKTPEIVDDCALNGDCEIDESETIEESL